VQAWPSADQLVDGDLLPQIPAMEAGLDLELTVGKTDPSSDLEGNGPLLPKDGFHDDVLPFQKLQPIHNVSILVYGIGPVQGTVTEVGFQKRLRKLSDVCSLLLDVFK